MSAMPWGRFNISCLVLCSLLAGRCTSTQAADIIDTIQSRSLFFETFDDGQWQARWKHSDDAKYNGRFTTDTPKTWTDRGLKIPEKNKYYGFAALLDEPADPVVASGPVPTPLVVQYEVKYESGVTCGGSYLKLLTASADLTPEGLVDSTPYSIMFGPDRCGGTSKVHLILRHRNPVSNKVEEKHLASPPAPETTDYTHIYTLKFFPDHKYEVLIDGVVKSSGSLLDAATLQPPLLPPREVPDPEDKKPSDWVDLSEIPDPEAVKPDTWDDREMIEDDKAVKPRGWLEDEPLLINDPAAKKPEDWDEEEDGVWEPNQIPNPRCKVGCGPWKRPMKRNPAWKGAWKPPLIKNPLYKGEWVQKTIPNPDFFEEAEPIRSGVGPIGAVALELWTIDSGYVFDNILITRDLEVAELALKKLWQPRHDAEVKAFEAQLKENEQKEKERKKEEEKQAKDKQKKSRAAGNLAPVEQLTEYFLKLFEEGGVLSPLAPFLAPLLDFLDEQPQAIVLLIGVVPLLLLAVLVLVRGFRGGTKETPAAAAAAAAAPATDEGGVAGTSSEEKPATEDAGTAGEVAEVQNGETAPLAAGASEAARDTIKEAAGAGSGEEIKEEEEEEEEQDQAPTGPRRRTPRAA